jgi:hypothetical protein
MAPGAPGPCHSGAPPWEHHAPRHVPLDRSCRSIVRFPALVTLGVYASPSRASTVQTPCAVPAEEPPPWPEPVSPTG